MNLQNWPVLTVFSEYDKVWLYFLYKLIFFFLSFYSNTYMKGTSKSAPEYSLLLKKPPTINKNSDQPKLAPQKAVLIIAFRIDLTFYAQIVWFGHQMAVFVQKRHKNSIFECCRFQKFNFECFKLTVLNTA